MPKFLVFDEEEEDEFEALEKQVSAATEILKLASTDLQAIIVSGGSEAERQAVYDKLVAGMASFEPAPEKV